nr:hypothetical protein Iba_scaffold39297CG0010 [Ipomoea batatas]
MVIESPMKNHGDGERVADGKWGRWKSSRRLKIGAMEIKSSIQNIHKILSQQEMLNKRNEEFLQLVNTLIEFVCVHYDHWELQRIPDLPIKVMARRAIVTIPKNFLTPGLTLTLTVVSVSRSPGIKNASGRSLSQSRS